MDDYEISDFVNPQKYKTMIGGFVLYLFDDTPDMFHSSISRRVGNKLFITHSQFVLSNNALNFYLKDVKCLDIPYGYAHRLERHGSKKIIWVNKSEHTNRRKLRKETLDE